METKLLKFWYKDPWMNPNPYCPETLDVPERYDFEMVIPADMTFLKTNYHNVMFIYPYSLEVWRMLDEQDNCRTRIYSLNNGWIIGFIGDGLDIHYETEMTFVDSYDMLNNSDYCVRQDREMYDSDFDENDELRKLIHSNLSIEERIDKLRELDNMDSKASTDFRDIRIIGVRDEYFKVIVNQYMPMLPTGDRKYTDIRIEYKSISDFFSEFYCNTSPHIMSHWISVDDFNNKLQETIKNFTI